MSKREIRDATEQVMCDEAEALAKLLATETRCVMVHVTVVEDNPDGDGELVRHGHGVGGNTLGKHLAGFQLAAEAQLVWLNNKGKVI